MHTSSANDLHWYVSSPVHELLVGPRGLRLDEWLANRQARIVKQGPHRIVYRVDLPTLSFYVKHNLLPDTRARLRQIVRPSKARMEYDCAVAVAARGVPTYTPLAVGEGTSRLQPGESFLITKALDDALPLNMFLETEFASFSPSQRVRVRQRLAVGLAQLVARLHDAGILHTDLHCGNFLIRLDDEGHPELFLIDLQAVRLRGALGWRASRKNLAMLNRWFYNRTTRADRLRFWLSYVQARRLSRDDAEPAQQVEAESDRSNEIFWRHRARRCLGSNKYFSQIRRRGLSGHATNDLDPATLEKLLADPDAPFRTSTQRVLKDSPSTTVIELDFPNQGSSRTLVYKRFRITSWTDPLANVLRTSAALRSWLNGHRMMDRGLPTARPLAVFHRRRCGLLFEGYLLTEKVPDAVDLGNYVQSLAHKREEQRRPVLRTSIDQLARLVREMHRRHLAHRDLKAGNILVNTSPEAGESPFVFIDLVGVTDHWHVELQRRIQNLARLNASFLSQHVVSRTDRLRFLRVYFQWGFFGRHTWKEWWRRIAAQTMTKVEQNARRGRPLA